MLSYLRKYSTLLFLFLVIPYPTLAETDSSMQLSATSNVNSSLEEIVAPKIRKIDSNKLVSERAVNEIDVLKDHLQIFKKLYKLKGDKDMINVIKEKVSSAPKKYNIPAYTHAADKLQNENQSGSKSAVSTSNGSEHNESGNDQDLAVQSSLLEPEGRVHTSSAAMVQLKDVMANAPIPSERSLNNINAVKTYVPQTKDSEIKTTTVIIQQTIYAPLETNKPVDAGSQQTKNTENHPQINYKPNVKLQVPDLENPAPIRLKNISDSPNPSSTALLVPNPYGKPKISPLINAFPGLKNKIKTAKNYINENVDNSNAEIVNFPNTIKDTFVDTPKGPLNRSFKNVKHITPELIKTIFSTPKTEEQAPYIGKYHEDLELQFKENIASYPQSSHEQIYRPINQPQGPILDDIHEFGRDVDNRLAYDEGFDNEDFSGRGVQLTQDSSFDMGLDRIRASDNGEKQAYVGSYKLENQPEIEKHPVAENSLPISHGVSYQASGMESDSKSEVRKIFTPEPEDMRDIDNEKSPQYSTRLRNGLDYQSYYIKPAVQHSYGDQMRNTNTEINNIDRISDRIIESSEPERPIIASGHTPHDLITSFENSNAKGTAQDVKTFFPSGRSRRILKNIANQKQINYDQQIGSVREEDKMGPGIGGDFDFDLDTQKESRNEMEKTMNPTIDSFGVSSVNRNPVHLEYVSKHNVDTDLAGVKKQSPNIDAVLSSNEITTDPFLETMDHSTAAKNPTISSLNSVFTLRREKHEELNDLFMDYDEAYDLGESDDNDYDDFQDYQEEDERSLREDDPSLIMHGPLSVPKIPPSEMVQDGGEDYSEDDDGDNALNFGEGYIDAFNTEPVKSRRVRTSFNDLGDNKMNRSSNIDFSSVYDYENSAKSRSQPAAFSFFAAIVLIGTGIILF